MQLQERRAHGWRPWRGRTQAEGCGPGPQAIEAGLPVLKAEVVDPLQLHLCVAVAQLVRCASIDDTRQQPRDKVMRCGSVRPSRLHRLRRWQTVAHRRKAHNRRDRTVCRADAEVVPCVGRLPQCRVVHLGRGLRFARTDVQARTELQAGVDEATKDGAEMPSCGWGSPGCGRRASRSERP